MQNFVNIPSTETLTNSRQELLNNDRTILSCSSGASFPTTNLEQGMLCLRADLNQLFQLEDLAPTWKLIFDLNKTAVFREYVDAQDATKVDSSDVVTTATADKILRLNANAKLPASITGDAATVGGHTAGVAASNVLLLDTGGKVPTGNLPVATSSAVGAVKPGAGLSVDASGTLNLASSGVPSGVICMWSGSATAIPTGWVLCNGTNGTPNLMDRFVLGAGSSYGVGAVGGEASHTLTVNEMPSHSHGGVLSVRTGYNAYSTFSDNGGFNGFNTVSTGATGGGAAHNNMPPYYALCFIMKQ